MPYTSLKMKPGVDVEMTPLLAEASWSYSAGLRFYEGLPQKTGGFAHLNSQILTGICTGLHAWADLSGNPYICAGTDQRLEIFFAGSLYDITPLRATTNPAVAFSTTSTSKTVKIHDVGHGAATGDWIVCFVPVSVGGIIIYGYYPITVVDSDNYTVQAASAATGTVVSGGAVPSFTTTLSSTTVTVTLNNHGLMPGNTWNVDVSTAVGGITLDGLYTVVTTPTGNTFTITAGSAASSGATASENSGNARIEYLLPTGLQSSTYGAGSSGYGLGGYGAGPYGISTSGAILTPLRQWFPDNFGEDLIANYTGSPIYLWTPPAETENRAIPIDTTNFPTSRQPPKQVNVAFVAPPQQMIIALGCDDPNTLAFDPNLIRWCDVANYLDWEADATNQAGSYRIPSGSELVGGISAPNFIAIWTDVDMWLMSYLGGTGEAELVWGFTKIAGGVDLLAARGVGIYRNVVFWISSNGFFTFNGNAVQQIPCPVWDKLWFNLNRQQIAKCTCEVNSWFQEISWAFPSASGNGTVDSRITFNIRENVWTYDDAPTLLARTAWIDDNVYGAPIGTDLNGYLQQAETGYDADGAVLPFLARTGWFSVAEGTLQAVMERIEGDLIVTGGSATIQLTVFSQDYATGPVRTYGPYNWNPSSGPAWSIVRARGRFMSVQISCNSLGVFCRLGNVRYMAMKAGRR